MIRRAAVGRANVMQPTHHDQEIGPPQRWDALSSTPDRNDPGSSTNTGATNTGATSQEGES